MVSIKITVMNKLEKQFFIALFFIFQLFSPVFAMGSFTDDEIIWQASTNEVIKYIDQGAPDSGKNDHPVVLQAKELSSILASIKFQQPEAGDIAVGQGIKAVFTAQQANLLGRYLEQGLKAAKPEQDIVFVMEKSVKRLTLLKPARYFVAGRVFYQANKLNIIIGDYDRLRNEALEAANDPTGTGHVRYSFDYGRRSKPSAFKKPIVNNQGVENKQMNNTRRADWLVIDINVASKAVEHMTRVRKRDEAANKRKQLIEVLGSEGGVHIDEINGSEKATHSLEQRLTELKYLRNKDLITEEEYAQQRKRILDDL